MQIKKEPEQIWAEYEKCKQYNASSSINLYEQVRQNENFYIGNQWEGLNAPDLDKPVLNFLKRVCSYIVAMLVSDDIAVEVSPFERTPQNERAARLLGREIERVIETTKAKSLLRDMLRNCAVDGDGCFYWYFDTEADSPQPVRGEIALELIDNTRIIFGNPFVGEVQRQPYLILVKREQTETVRDRARRVRRLAQGAGDAGGTEYALGRGGAEKYGSRAGDKADSWAAARSARMAQSRDSDADESWREKGKDDGFPKGLRPFGAGAGRGVPRPYAASPVATPADIGADIRPDVESRFDGESGAEGELTTVYVKLWKERGTVRFCEVTRNAVVRPATDTGYRLYPVSYMSFEKIKNSCHGQALLTGLIPNQIAVNKLWAMAIHHQHTMAFPKIFYDRLKIDRWSNRVGEAIGVAGNPNEAVAAGFRAPDMSAQLTEIVDKTIAYTKEFMGASDAALGTIRPDNTSAIIAVQKATAAPLEVQKLALYQFVEDFVRIVAGMIVAHCGTRIVSETSEDGAVTTGLFDFGSIDLAAMTLNVNVGASSYWSELNQLGTLDNLFARGVIQDALLYLESVPDGYIRNKEQMIRRLKEREDAEERK